MAAISTARRTLVAPVDIAYLEPGLGRGAMPPVALLGRGDGAVLLLRFALPLPPEAVVLEAYLALRRAPDVEVDPTPVVLHVARVVEPWDGRSVRWALQPRIDEGFAPATRVAPGWGPIVRLDVRDVVERWRRQSRDEWGVAVVAEGRSRSGVAFALAPSREVATAQQEAPLNRSEQSAASLRSASFDGAALPVPELELYLK
ncbi:MAG: DNRLRE domain-containing protein [Polyangiaceae bacterium]|jgi:hypothetical protein